MELSELKDRIITSFNGTEDDLNEVLELVSITFKEKAFLKSYTKQLTTYNKVVNMKSVVMATHFHLTSVHPKWARKMKFVKKIGKHLFYLEK